MADTEIFFSEKNEDNNTPDTWGVFDYIAAAGSAGVAIQNWEAVAILLKALIPVHKYSTPCIHTLAIASGGVCSGLANYKMNVDLLGQLYERFNEANQRTDPLSGLSYYINPKTGKPYYTPETLEDQATYYSYIGVFVVTGVLFGLIALTFAMESPLAMLAIPVGVFVTAITILQEIEALLQGYDEQHTIAQELKALLEKHDEQSCSIAKQTIACLEQKYQEQKSNHTSKPEAELKQSIRELLQSNNHEDVLSKQALEALLQTYDTQRLAVEPQTFGQKLGMYIGYFIAIGNVVALNLAFSLGLASGLIALHVAALPALIIGFITAFSCGLLTEGIFYTQFLPEFCENFGEKWTAFINSPSALLGLLCVSINAFVNGALAYSAFELLTVLFLAAHLSLPPVAIMTTLSVLSSFFAGSASFILGIDFWMSDTADKPKPSKTLEQSEPNSSWFTFKSYGLFGDGKPQQETALNNPNNRTEKAAEQVTETVSI